MVLRMQFYLIMLRNLLQIALVIIGRYDTILNQSEHANLYNYLSNYANYC